MKWHVRLLMAGVALGAVWPGTSVGQESGFLTEVRGGTCANPDAAVLATLTLAVLPNDDPVGASAASPATSSFSTIPLSLTTLIETDHVVTITSGDEIVACGGIGGSLNNFGALVFAIAAEGDPAVSGIAYVAPNAADPGQVDVSLFVAGEPVANVAPPAPTAVGPTPTPTFDQLVADFTPLPDVRELAIRPGGLIGEKFSFSGTILSIGVAPEGRVYSLGDENEQKFSVQMQVTVFAPDGSTEVVFVGFNGDTAGMFEDTFVTVYGTVIGSQTFTNGFGGTVSQPLVDAEFVLIG